MHITQYFLQINSTDLPQISSSQDSTICLSPAIPVLFIVIFLSPCNIVLIKYPQSIGDEQIPAQLWTSTLAEYQRNPCILTVANEFRDKMFGDDRYKTVGGRRPPRKPKEEPLKPRLPKSTKTEDLISKFSLSYIQHYNFYL